MATTISTNGRKKLKTLQDEFNDKFPYLKIEFFSKPTIDDKGESTFSGSVYKIDNSKTLSEVRTKTGDGKISINGRKKVDTLEREFQDVFGLYIQVCFWFASTRLGEEYDSWSQLPSGGYDYSLSRLNRRSKKNSVRKPKKDW